MKKVSIIVTSYNNSHNLEHCIESLINQNYDKNIIDLEIIFVDSGSTDSSIDVLNRYKDRIKTVLKPQKTLRLSPAMARNIGVENARGDVLIFTDSDCIFPQDWVQNMVDCFKDPLIDCVIGNREPDFGEGLGSFMRRYDFILYSNKFTISEKLLINTKSIREGVPLILLSGNNFAIKKELWNKLGGMKSVFKNPAGEDIMLETEIIKNNGNILFFPENKIKHIHPISFKDFFRKSIQWSEATYLLGKYSDGFVTWRNFAERGHILNMGEFSIYVLFIVLILLIAIFLKTSPYLILAVFIIMFLSLAIGKLACIDRRLKSILTLKGENYKRNYESTLLKLFYFSLFHLLMNFLTSINFLLCIIKDKYAIITKDFGEKR